MNLFNFINVNRDYIFFRDSFYEKYVGKPFAIHLSYGIDNRAYWYYFENHGFDNYNIYMRVEM